MEQSALAYYLDAVGIPRVLTGKPDWSPSVRWLREEVAGHTAEPAILALTGAEIPNVVPARLSDVTVWYFALPPSMECHVTGLLRTQLGCYGGLTGDPWRNAVFLYLTEGMGGDAEQGTAIHLRRELSFRPEGTNIYNAGEQGFVLALFDFQNSIHLRGIPVGDDLLQGMSACAVSSFQKPQRVYSLQNLQTRTRAVEDAGVDLEGPPSNGNHLLRVFSSRCLPRQQDALPPHLLSRLPPVSWHSMNSAVVGQLRNVTYFPEDCNEERSHSLKMTVNHDVFGQVQAGRYEVRVQRITRRERSGTVAYVVRLHTPDAISSVVMEDCDARFQFHFRQWANAGECNLAIENLRNGRLHRLTVKWPSDLSGCRVDCGLPAHSFKANPIRTDNWLDALARSFVPQGVRRISCYYSNAISESEWDPGDD